MINFLKKYQKVQWVVFFIALLIYINTIPNKWAIDDSVIIYQNNFVKKGISGIPKILTKDAFAGLYGQDVNAVAGARYRPLTPILFALQAELFASKNKDENQKIENDKAAFKLKDLSEKTWFPNVLHFFNMIWHGILCLVLYKTLLLLFSFKNKQHNFKTFFLAFVTALVYTVHPLHTEAVANAKGLDEILAMLGVVVSLYCILKLYYLSTFSDVNKSKWLLGAVTSYFLALLSKESAVTFIAVIPLVLYFFTAANLKSIFRLSIPLLVTLVLFLGIRQPAQYQLDKAPIAEELMNNPFLILDPIAQYAPLVEGSSIKKLVKANANTFTKMPYANELATNFYTYGLYLKLLFIPKNLSVDYYPRHIEIKSFSDLSELFSLLHHLRSWQSNYSRTRFFR